MDKTVLHVIILGVISGLTRGSGVLPDALITAVGETVTFTTTLTPPATPFLEVSWNFSGITIIKSSNDNDTAPEYEGRITLFRSTGSLQLRSVTVSDSGEYNVSIIPSTGAQEVGRIILSVQVPVSNVVVTPSSTYLIEYFSYVRLSCSSSGSSPYFLWLNGSSEVTSSYRVQLTDGGSTLNIRRVTRYDQGPYRCHAFNPVSNELSDPVTLSISYGPENINLTVSPSQEYYGEGSDVILSCSADSRPPAIFFWDLNGYFLPDRGPELRLTNIQMNQNGTYGCLAFNPRYYYFIFRTYSTVLVSVLKRISKAVIAPSDPPIEGKPFNLTCDAAGAIFNRTWKWDSSNLTLDDGMNLYDNNRVLSFRNLTHQHSGKYSCEVSNPFTSDEAEFTLVIYYGPENIHICGPSEIRLHENFTLICSAESIPASYSWTLNGTEIHNSAVFAKNSESSDSGNYTCEVLNIVTGATTSAVHRLSVAERISGASITSTNLMIEGKSFNLTCDAAGSILTRTWKKNDLDLTLDDDMKLYDNNRVLSFRNLTHRHSGKYLCKVSNPVSSDEAEFFMVVYYGPENIHISGPSEIRLHETFTLTCSAESIPASYSWTLNGTEIHNSAVFTKNSESSDSGNYTCEVMNFITGRTSSAVHRLSVAAFISDRKSGGLSGGAIAGIVLAIVCLILATIIVAGGYYIYRKSKKKTLLISEKAEENVDQKSQRVSFPLKIS